MDANDLEWLPSLTEQQTRELHRLYQDEWWTRGRSASDVQEMLRHTDYVFALGEPGSGRLAAFARVLTDRVFKALIFDVIVAPAWRDRGLGSRLLERILGHADLAAVRHFELYCLPELVPFYRRQGFTTDVGGVTLMRRAT